MPSSSNTTVGGGSSAKKSAGSKVKRKVKKKDEEAERKAEEEAQEENEIEFQKALLEVRVNELETLNLGLKRKSDYLESQNDIYKTQLQELRTEKEELVGYFERGWKEEKVKVTHLEETVNSLTEEISTARSSYQQVLVNKQLEFDEMKTTLQKEIQDLELQLARIEEFRVEKDDLTQKFRNLEQTLELERKEHAAKYEAQENEVIIYRETIKQEAVEMLVQISKDIQKAGKLCLNGAVKAAIAANVELKPALETASKDNLALRDRLDSAALELKKAKATAAKLEHAKAIERKKCGQLTRILQILAEKQAKMDEKIKKVTQVEQELSKLQMLHSMCKSEEEVQKLIRFKTRDLEAENAEIKTSVQNSIFLETELEKLRSIFLKLSLTMKDLTEASNEEEFEFLCQRLKLMLGKVHAVTCEFPNLSQQMKARLMVNAPSVLPYFK